MNADNESRLRRLEAFGQQVWLDYIDRELLDNGGLERLINDDGISGVTSNPAIFEEAISQHAVYDTAITLLARRGLDAQAIYETLAIEDIGRAADLLRPAGVGYACLEVSPQLANDTAATVAEAKRLWDRLARPNVMIKVPATSAGLPAIRQLIAAGINVNVTLLFSVARYREVAESYLAGLEDRLVNGGEIDHVASVASFFLSRIDTLVDGLLERSGQPAAQSLRGRTGIACARLAYQEYRNMLNDARWRSLAARGAKPQRLLWASTSAKNPAYPDVMYADALIGPDTINTMPLKTIVAYRDHGNPALRLEQELEAARALPAQLAAAGVHMDEVGIELEREGERKFTEPHQRLLAMLARRADELTAHSGSHA